MQVSAISAAFTGLQRKNQANAYDGEKSNRRSFEEFLLVPDVSSNGQEEIDAALERAMQRMKVLVGTEMAESVVNEDGTINLARYAQIMSSVTRPYGMTDRPSSANIPQVVNLVA